jgi:hypothetical protein
LAEACILAAFDQERPQGFVMSGIQGSRHFASRRSLREAKQSARNLHLDILHKMIERDVTPRLRQRAAMSELSHTRQNSHQRRLTARGALCKIADGGSRKGSKGNAVRVLGHVMPRLPPQL